MGWGGQDDNSPGLPPGLTADALRQLLGQQQGPPGMMGSALQQLFAPNLGLNYHPEQPPTLPQYIADPFYRSDMDIQRTALNPPSKGQSLSDLGDLVMPFIAGGAPGGALGAGIKISGEQSALADELRATHLARDDALPLTGAKAEVTPPPHIQTMADMDGLVSRYADWAQQGKPWRDWYTRSGRAILSAAGDNTDTADKFAAGLARTSPQTDVASNATHAITLHNQAMVGEPLSAGRFPNVMGKAVESYYYGGEPISGEKIGPFMGATAEEWNPDFAHTFVNDMWNMRASEFPGVNGAPYNGTPTLGQHNFARILANRASDLLEQRTGVPWTPKQTQAASWTAIKAATEGTPLEQAGQDFADALQRNYAQLSWESAPGLTTNHLPEFHTAAPEVRQAYHDAISGALTDDQGRDIIAQHLGLLTGQSFDAPGVYLGRTNPGSQSQVALGAASGGWQQGIDPASRALADTSELTRGLLLRQDAVAYHKPTYVGGPGLEKQPKLANMVQFDLGRPLTSDEANAVHSAMSDATGTDFFSPIGTPTGFRFLNVPEASGVSNLDFVNHARNVANGNALPGEVSMTKAHADSGYYENDWSKNPNGEDYFRDLGGTGSPDLQRASKELLATLGPRISQIEEDFARTHGWTPDRSTRVWETNPEIRQLQGAVVPSPPRPWVQRPSGLLNPQ